MVNITKHELNTIYYNCDCGAKGRCFFKPLTKGTVIVVDIQCPVCRAAEKITLLPSEEHRSINELEVSWAPSINEEILGEEE